MLGNYPHISVIWDEILRISKNLPNLDGGEKDGNKRFSKNIMSELLDLLFGSQEELKSRMNNFVSDIIDLFGDDGMLLTSILVENIDSLHTESMSLRKECFNGDNNHKNIPKSSILEVINNLFLGDDSGIQSNSDNSVNNKTGTNEEFNRVNRFETSIEEEIRIYKSEQNKGFGKDSDITYSRDDRCEKVYITPSIIPESISSEIESKLVSVNVLNKIFRSAFKGIKNFNYVQSKVFNSVYLSNRNVLVAAPTGSGKTNIALLAILRSIYSYMGINGLSSSRENTINASGDTGELDDIVFAPPDPKKFKIVYLGPMKSLVSEISRKYMESLKELNIKVIEITSDESVSKEQIDKSHIIVTVPEKFDILTRTNSLNNLLDILECLIIDEIHMLGDERGPSVEAVVTRILYSMEMTQKVIRMVGLSATLPNWKDFSIFLNVNSEDSYFFSQYFRPTPLEKTIIGVFEKKIGENSKIFKQVKYKSGHNSGDSVKDNKRILKDTGKKDKSSCNKCVSESDHYRTGKQGSECSSYDRCFSGKDGISKGNETEKPIIGTLSDMYNHIAYEIVSECIKKNEQVIVFVHSRNETLLTARYFKRCFESIMNDRSNTKNECFDSLNRIALRNKEQYSEILKDNLKKETVDHSILGQYMKMLRDKGNSEIREFYEMGLGIHHAGLLSRQRKLSEALFTNGSIKVLVSTATLAWGVNLPARHVIIKGTDVYDSKKGRFKDLGVLDILQIFGRAGRPQYEPLGSAYLITTSNKVKSYLRKLTFQSPIESQLSNESNLCNLLNSEISRGSILNVNEAFKWLQNTFLMTRAKISPINYGISVEEFEADKNLVNYSHNLIKSSLSLLYRSKLIKYNNLKEDVSPTNYGKLASKYYIDFNTANTFRERLEFQNGWNMDEYKNDQMDNNIGGQKSDFDVLEMIGEASEFSGMSVRDEELEELREILKDPVVSSVISRGNAELDLEKISSKVLILLISYALRMDIKTPTLIMDRAYVSQNGIRILRYIFELIQIIGFGMSERIHRILEWSKMLEYRIFHTHSILRYFVYYSSLNKLPSPSESNNDNFKGSTVNLKCKGPLKLNSVVKLESCYSSWEMIKDLSFVELNGLVYSDAATILSHISYVPYFKFKEVFLSPITNKVAKLGIKLLADWNWNERWNGDRERFYIWVSNPNDGALIYSQLIHICKKNIRKSILVSELIPIPDENIPYYLNITLVSDKWVGLEYSEEVNLRFSLEFFSKTQNLQSDLVFGMNDNCSLGLSDIQDTTELLKVTPIPISSLKIKEVIENYHKKGVFFFNPIQSQLFHVLFHSNENVFLGAPTGSGKTIIAEIAIFRIIHTNEYFTNKVKNSNMNPSDADKSMENRVPKAVYIAPLKSLARERLQDWTKLFVEVLGLKVVLLTGSSKCSLKDLNEAFLVITTPEKWESVTRKWFSESKVFFRNIKLVIFDEVHLIGQDQRGSVMETLVCKTKYISKILGETHNHIRTVSLSTSLSNSKELSSWLDVSPSGYYNFSPSIRPVPCTVYISGFQEKNYCPRMDSMNRPIYNKILSYSPEKPVIIFVASRRQTRETALSLSRLCFCQGDPYKFVSKLKAKQQEIKDRMKLVKDKSLRHTLEYGIGIHHAGLVESDREIVEDLFLNGYIQIIVSTSTLAWGVNFPAHLSIIKGTEYYDGKLGQYIDYPITDVLQMIGRAGRPQFDSTCTACILTIDSKKSFYKRFLYDSLPLESSYSVSTLVEILNAEISSRSILTLADALCFLSNSFYFRRVISNPGYYDPTVFQNEDIGVSMSNYSENTSKIVVFIVEKLINGVIETLVELGCIRISDSFCKNENYEERRWSCIYPSSRLGFDSISPLLYKNHNFSDFISPMPSPQPTLRETIVDNERVNRNSDAYLELYGTGEGKQQVSICLLPTVVGQISSFFYVKCSTVSKMDVFLKRKRKDIIEGKEVTKVSWIEVLAILSLSSEFEQHPVRHNEDLICKKMLTNSPLGKLPFEPMSSPHQKVFILLQFYLFSIPVPIIDFINDIYLILEQAPRILHSFIYLNKFGRHLSASAFKSTILLLECFEQKLNPFVSPYHQLPGYSSHILRNIDKYNLTIYEFVHKVKITNEININKHVCADKGCYYDTVKNANRFIDSVPLFCISSEYSQDEMNGKVSIYTCIQDPRREFPSEWFRKSWIVLEEINTDTILYLERLNKRKFRSRTSKDEDLPNEKSGLDTGIMEMEMQIQINNFNIDSFGLKTSIFSEKFMGINVSFLL